MKLLLFLLSFILSSCFSQKHLSEVPIVQVNAVVSDIQIPKHLLIEIEKELAEDSKLLTTVYVFIPLQLELTEKNSGVLRENPTKINFPKGGGLLDLKKE